MRIHHPSFFSNEEITECITTDNTHCVNTQQNLLKLGVSHSIIYSTFTCIHSPVESGGVLYIHSESSSETSLTVQSCFFSFCTTTTDFSRRCGGGAIYMDSGTLLSIVSTTFISCSTKSYGGAIYSENNCKTFTISQSAFISCTSDHGAGLMSYCGPELSITSSHFICCVADRFGGGVYHDSSLLSSSFTLSDSVFTGNQAGSRNNNNRGGGALEDYKQNLYQSSYSFSFFTNNAAPYGKGNDISIQVRAVTQSPVTHCLTTTASENAFWNNGSNVDNWLPLTTTNASISESLYTAHETVHFQNRDMIIIMIICMLPLRRRAMLFLSITLSFIIPNQKCIILR